MTLSAQLRELAGKAASDNPGVSFDAKARLSRAMMVNRETIIAALELQERVSAAGGYMLLQANPLLPQSGGVSALKGGSQ